MRSAEEVAVVHALAGEGRSASEVAGITGIPRSTVREWLARPVRDRCSTCGGAHRYENLGAPYAYLLGLYLGDGCITDHPRGVYRLRIFLDVRYPGIVSSCASAMRWVVPANAVTVHREHGNYVERTEPSHVQVSAYSKTWICLFPQHGIGRKHTRPIVLKPWQRELVGRYPRALVKGLIHSDGSRFVNSGRGWQFPRYSFKNRSADIRRIFSEACDLIGVRWTAAPDTVYVSRKADVALLDEFIGPKA